MRRKVDKNNKDYFFNSEITGPSGKGPIPPIDAPISDDEYDDDDEEFDDIPEACYMFDAISTMISIDKPFGMLFDVDKIEKFLVSRGYKIADKFFSHINGSIRIATKDDPSSVEDSPEGAKNHVRAVFSNEVQDIILKWLLKIGK